MSSGAVGALLVKAIRYRSLDARAPCHVAKVLGYVVDREAVRRWIAGHRAAERRHLQLMQREGSMSPEASFRAAMELCDLVTSMEDDPVRDREIAEARRLWARLKKPWVARLA